MCKLSASPKTIDSNNLKDYSILHYVTLISSYFQLPWSVLVQISIFNQNIIHFFLSLNL